MVGEALPAGECRPSPKPEPPREAAPDRCDARWLWRVALPNCQRSTDRWGILARTDSLSIYFVAFESFSISNGYIGFPSGRGIAPGKSREAREKRKVLNSWG